MRRITFAIALVSALISAAFAQLPSEQLVLWKVWTADSAALMNQGYGDYVFSARDTVVLEGSDFDTVTFNIADARGYFTVWVIPDTANFPTAEGGHDHEIGETDSLSLSYTLGLNDSVTASNPVIELEYIKNLDWDAEGAYYESIVPPVSEYLQFYIEHSGETDTSAVIIELQWQ